MQEEITPLYHYTSVEGLYGIFKDYSEKNPFVTMRATDISFLNDSSEFLFGVEVCKEVLNMYEDNHKIDYDNGGISWIVNSYVHSPKENSKLFNFKQDICVISLSKTRSSAAMWSMYASQGKGVSIIFNSEILRSIKGVYLNPCFYAKDSFDFLNKYEREFEQFYNNSKSISISGVPEECTDGLKRYINDFGFCQSLFSNLVSIIKNSAYDYEQEYRMDITNMKPYLFRASKGLIIPYKEIKIPIEAIEGILIGPVADYSLIKLSIQKYFNSLGLEKLTDKVFESNVPYRG